MWPELRRSRREGVSDGNPPLQAREATELAAEEAELPYECETCDKAFRTSGDLVKHTRLHTLGDSAAAPLARTPVSVPR
jgi:hypothetical protein